MLKTKCGHCGAKYEYDDDEGGQTIACECGTQVQLPPKKLPPPKIDVPKVEAPPADPVIVPPLPECPRCHRGINGKSFPTQLGNVCGECYREIRSPTAEEETLKRVPFFFGMRAMSFIFNVIGGVMTLGSVLVVPFLYGSTNWTTFAEGLVILGIGQLIDCARVLAAHSHAIRINTYETMRIARKHDFNSGSPASPDTSHLDRRG
jgi:hypothetical protein